MSAASSAPVFAALDAHIDTVQRLREQEASIATIGRKLAETLATGNKILLCGNGGSAADAQHVAAEIVGRFQRERRGLPALALTTDTSVLTSLSNDYGFEYVFARQVEALAQSGDALVAISTSGRSANVVAAAVAARRLGCKTIGLLGGDGGPLRQLVDQAVIVPAHDTARIQECHILIGHIWCAQIDATLAES